MLSIMDRNMGSHNDESCVKRFMDLALKCTKDEPRGRPLMLEIVRELENIISTLPQLSHDHTTTNHNTNTSSSSSLGFSPFSSSAGLSAQLGNFGRINLDLSTDQYHGSDLVSGVIPTIKPR